MVKVKHIRQYKGFNISEYDNGHHFTFTGCPWLFERLDSVFDYIDDNLDITFKLNPKTNGMRFIKPGFPIEYNSIDGFIKDCKNEITKLENLNI